MPALVLKNIPEALHERLKAQAAANRRSLTQEAIQLLERGVLSRPLAPELPQPVFVAGLSDLPAAEFADAIEAAINEGRPLILVDTNVLMGLLLQGGYSEPARALFQRDSDWHTENLLFHELTNALAVQCRAAGLELSLAQRFLSRARELLAEGRHEVSDADALAAAAHFGISGHDARFIVLARALGTPLVTEDRRLRDAVPAHTRSIAQALMS